jgi:UDP-N-acetylglucosamine--N-acetylmuramyl-(pentapeptide) pyrophosphoryl-undecaprenol N-acetylglucosamine transferase
MKILITGGGTGGHVSPAVAVITRLRELSALDNSPLELHYVGSVSGIERPTMEGLGVPYTAIQTGKLRRYLSIQTPVDLLVRLPLGAFQALNAVRRFRPDVIFSTGGYVCVPTVVAGWLLRVPALTHEQTALVGLANRIAGRFARRIAVSYAQSARYFPPGKVVLTGNPIRPSLLEGNAARGAARFGFDPAMPTVYVTGGAQGSHALNMAVEGALPDLLGVCQVIHQCGEGPNGSGADLKSLQAASAALPPYLQERYRVQPFVGDEIADVYALASLVVGRAGAGTVNELANLGKPSILVPLPGAKEQAANAHTLEAEGASITIVQEELTPRSLTATVTDLISQPEKQASMSQATHSLSTEGAADKIIAELMQLAKAR